MQLPVEKRRLSRRTTAAAVSILLLIPVTLFVGVYYLNNQRYGLVSVLLECMAPFFLVFEGRRPQARELVVIAVLCAISVAGRAAFFMLPQFKPVMAMTIISGVALGGVLDQTIHELAIICQVKDLPEAITADISGLKLGESLRITDLKLPSGVTTELAGDVIVAIVEAPRVSGEEAAPAAEEAGSKIWRHPGSDPADAAVFAAPGFFLSPTGHLLVKCRIRICLINLEKALDL